MKNRLLSIFAAIAVILSLSACQNGDTEQTAPLSEAVISETTQSLETTIQSEIEQTSNLTFEDINIIEINGKQVSLPFKVEDLGDGYSLGELQGYKEKVSAIFYNEQVVAVVDLDNEDNIFSITFTSDALIHNVITVCNLSTENNFDEVIRMIGSPTKQKELALIYEYAQGQLYIGSENGSLGFNFLEISTNGGTENE